MAALTSAISLIEPAVAWMTERYRISHASACVLSESVMWLLSLGTVFSFNFWQDTTLFGKNVFELLDYLTTSWMLPLGGLFVAIFTGWVMTQESTRQELGAGCGYPLWRFIIRYITPVGIVLVFLNSIGVLNF